MEPLSVNKMLRREIFLSEILRAKLLAWVFFYAIIILLIIRLFFVEYIKFVVSNPDIVFIFQAILLSFVIREVVVIRVIKNKLKNNQDIKESYRYITNLIEITYPTIFLVTLGFYIKSLSVLFTPIIFVYFLIILLSTLSLDFKISFVVGIQAAFGYIIVFLIFRNQHDSNLTGTFLNNEILHIGRAAQMILGGYVAGIVANQMKMKILNVNNAILERNKIVNIFGQQVSSSIVDELLKNENEIESKKKYVCVMFLDIRGFTQFAENKKPEEIISYQNSIFGFMIEIIAKHNGIINQFLGDGYMATFGAPISTGDDSQNAVNAAIEIIEMLKTKNENADIPDTKIGIGLHSGYVVAGNVGTEVRKQYSISGNTVILASRIEQLNKIYGSQLLISKEVISSINTNSIKPYLIGDVEVKGREKPIEIWKLK
jgi:adenylate cyclase